MMLSAPPTSVARSCLEEMLDILNQQDENSEKSKDLPPALPSRPTSKARLPSACCSLPSGFKVDSNGQLEITKETRVSNTKENIKRKEESQYKLGTFGGKKRRKYQNCVDSNPYDEEKAERYQDSSMNFLPSSEQLECNDSISYFIENKLRVWCQLEEGRWGSGKIQSTSGDEAVVSLSTRSIVKIPVVELFPANPDILECTDELMQLVYLNEPSVLHNMKQRYLQDMIYTKAGPVLVSVNPFKDVPIYGTDIVTAYKQKDMNEPHVYAVANAAYNEMITHGKNQSIIISGESGAGKTETTKYAMQFLAALGGGFCGIGDNLLQANMILEAFGNAKTSRNDNSSRFGKLIEIYFSTLGKIYAAKIQTFMLEKSRLVQLANGERSYHIFYQLCAGAPSRLRGKLKIKEASEYNYLNQSECLVVDGVNDALKFHKLVEALDAVKICKEDQEQMFAMVAAVLWLGNISFKEIENENGVEVLADEALTNAAMLLSCSASDLIVALSTHNTQAGKEGISKKLTLRQAFKRRDVIARFLYASMFDWLVEKVNESLTVGKSNNATYISILDIYGFESFKTNSFDQFCINYANERLQQHFNRHLFKLEKEAYEEDGIDWPTVEFKDNQECLDLIEKKPLSLLSLLDEESNLPNATDLTFANKLKRYFNGNSCFKGQRGRAFGICHFAGEVIYDTNGFLEKNQDQLHSDFIQLLSACNSQLLRIFASRMSSQSPNLGSSGGLEPSLQGVGSKFKGELFKLMNRLEKTNPHFISCIKPNSKQLPGIFDEELVFQQLRYYGILEAVRVAKWGYPIRMMHQHFVDRYGFLLLEKNVSMDPLSTSVAILKRFNIAPELYQIGFTKVYLRTSQIAKLEEHRKLFLEGIVKVQKCFRGYRTRCFYHGEIKRINCSFISKDTPSDLTDEQIVEITCLQSVIRGQLARKHFDKLKLKQLTSDTNTRRKSARKISEVKVIPQEQVDIQTTLVAELQRRVDKAEATVLLKEEENAALKDQLQQLEKRWSNYEAKMKAMEETWQTQMASLQVGLSAATKNLAAVNTTGLPRKLESVTSPQFNDSEENASVGSQTPGELTTPEIFPNGVPDGKSGNDPKVPRIALGNLIKEFECQKHNFDTHAMELSEARAGKSALPPTEELKQLKFRFETWKNEYKARLQNMRTRLHKLGQGQGSRRKWWGRFGKKRS